jgi:transposase-like protein
MDTHKNARLTPKGREEMVRAVVDYGLSKAAAARQFNTTAKTVAKWVERFRALGIDGLRDRSSRPISSTSQTPLAVCAVIGLASAALHRTTDRSGNEGLAGNGQPRPQAPGPQ